MLRFRKITGLPPAAPRRRPGREPSGPGLAAPPPPPPPRSAARPQRTHVRPTSYLALSLLFSGLLFGLFFVSDNGFLAVRKKRAQLAEMQAEVTDLAAQNQRLEEEVAALKNDPSAVERIARESLNLVAKGDVVLVLPSGWQKKVAPTPSAPRRPPAR